VPSGDAAQRIIGNRHGQAVCVAQHEVDVLKDAPPPVNTIPLSTISAASSGAVCSSATLDCLDDRPHRLGQAFPISGAR